MTCQLNQALPLPCCLKSISIGKLVAGPKTGIWVMLENLSTGHVTALQTNTDGAGQVDLDLATPDIEFPVDQPYEIWVQESLSAIRSRMNFYVNGDTSTPYAFVRTRFEALKGAAANVEVLIGKIQFL